MNKMEKIHLEYPIWAKAGELHVIVERSVRIKTQSKVNECLQLTS